MTKNFFFLFILLVLTSCQSWFYRPSAEQFMDPRVVGVDYIAHEFRIPWDDRLHGWRLHSKFHQSGEKALGTVAYFYDASKNITFHFRQVKWLTENNFEVFLFDYPGFGKSSGKVNGNDLVENIKRVINFVHYRKQGPLITICQSTGGLLCSKAIGGSSKKWQSKIDLLVLDNTYASYSELMKFYLSKRWYTKWMKYLVPVFMWSEQSAVEEISKITVPTLVIHAQGNTSVPFSLGQWVYKNLNTKKHLWKVQKVGHLESFKYKAQQDFFLKLIFNQKKYFQK